MLVKADEARIVNTSSVNGFWASIGMGQAHTAYSAAKFAVKGFSEALMNDLRLHAPHVKCSVVMPGHIGTSIVTNSRKVQTGESTDRLNADEVAAVRKRLSPPVCPMRRRCRTTTSRPPSPSEPAAFSRMRR